MLCSFRHHLRTLYDIISTFAEGLVKHSRQIQEKDEGLRERDTSITRLKRQLEEEQEKQTRRTTSADQEAQRQGGGIAALEVSYAGQLEEAKSGYDTRLQVIKNESAERVAALEANYNSRVKALEQRQEEERRSDLLRRENAERIAGEKDKTIEALKLSHAEQLASEQTGYKQRLDDITAENKRLQEGLETHHAEVLAALKKQLATEHRAEMQKLQTTHREELAKSQQFRDAHFANVKKLKQEIEQLRMQQEQVLQAKDAELQRLRDTGDKQSNAVKVQQQTIEQLHAQRDQELRSVNEELQRLRSANNMSSGTITEQGQALRQLREELAAANAEKEATQRRTEAVQKQLEEAGARNVALEARLEIQRVARRVQEKEILQGEVIQTSSRDVVVQGVVNDRNAPSANPGRVVSKDADTYDRAIAEYKAQDEQRFFSQLGERFEGDKQIITYVHPDVDLTSPAAMDPKNQVMYIFDAVSGKLESMSSGEDVTCKLPPQPKNKGSGYEMVRIDYGKPSYDINIGEGESSTTIMTHKPEGNGIQYTIALRSNTPSKTLAQGMQGRMAGSHSSRVTTTSPYSAATRDANTARHHR